MSSSPSSHRRQRLLGISLKLYFKPEQTFTYYQSLRLLAVFAKGYNVRLLLIPSLLTLPLLLQPGVNTRLNSDSFLVSENGILLGAQDCSSYDSGAYTGEISPSELSSLGCDIVELGHAERRKLFGETNDNVARKAKAVLRNNMIPLVCIGEQTFTTVENAVRECTPQITSILDLPKPDVNHSSMKGDIIFAYEPVWAIGQSKPASAEYVVSVTKALRKICEERGREEVRIIYGGSAGPGTFADMKEGVDGLFLGRFGHDLENVRGVIKEIGTLRTLE
jgi:triosephosphate isomerase